MAGFIQGHQASGAEVSSIRGALDYEITKDWKLDAECARLGKDAKPLYDPDMWFNEIRPRVVEARKLGVMTNRETIDKAMNICNTLCPVRAECWESATEDDIRVSVRGGIAPISRLGSSGTISKAAECRKGHDLTLRNALTVDSRCRECKRLRERITHKPTVVQSKDDTTDLTA